MLGTLNKFLMRVMPIMTPVSVIVGVLLSEWLVSFVFLVPWIFAFMTFSGSLSSKFSNVRMVMQKPFPLITCLVVLHIIMPIVAFAAGNIVFPADKHIITGLILAFVIPTGISSLIWVTIYKGNVILTLSIILIDTILAPFIVPTILQILVGSAIEMNGIALMKGLIWMIVIPSFLGMALNGLTNGEVTVALEPKLAPFSKLGLAAVVALNSSTVAPYFKNINGEFFIIAVTVLILALLGYVVGWFISTALRMEKQSIITLTYNSGMRNISAGAVLAITYFPAPVAVPVIIGMLFQQIIASLAGSVLSKSYKLNEAQVVSS